MKRTGRWQRWFPLALWSVVVPILLLTPDTESIGALEEWIGSWAPGLLDFVVAWGDKLVHILLFGVGAAVFHRAGLPLIPAMVASALYGGAMELIQCAFPPRSPDWLDALANSTGSGLYGILMLGTRRWRR